MKKQITAMLLIMFLSTTLSAANLKVGVVSMKKIFSESPQAKRINQRLQESIKEPKEGLSKLAAELEELGKKIEKDKLMSSPSQVQKMKEEYQQKAIAFKQKEAALNRGLQNFEARASVAIFDVVKGVSNKIAKNEKYDLIIHEGIIYSNEKLDMTDKVLKIMKQDFEKQKAEEAKNAKADKKQ